MKKVIILILMNFLLLYSKEIPSFKKDNWQVIEEKFLKSGSLVLGGGWLPTIFKNVSVKELLKNTFSFLIFL